MPKADRVKHARKDPELLKRFGVRTVPNQSNTRTFSIKYAKPIREIKTLTASGRYCYGTTIVRSANGTAADTDGNQAVVTTRTVGWRCRTDLEIQQDTLMCAFYDYHMVSTEMGIERPEVSQNLLEIIIKVFNATPGQLELKASSKDKNAKLPDNDWFLPSLHTLHAVATRRFFNRIEDRDRVDFFPELDDPVPNGESTINVVTNELVHAVASWVGHNVDKEQREVLAKTFVAALSGFWGEAILSVLLTALYSKADQTDSEED